MSDKAGINLLNPAFIHEYIEYGNYANALAILFIFPLFISYIEFSEHDSYELLLFARKLLELYIDDLLCYGADQFKEGEFDLLFG